jgi:SET domain-containing protein
VISQLDGIVVPEPTRISVYVACEKQHIDPTNGLQYLNHACNPNTEFRGRTLVALREIRTGEELTIDYRHTEMTISHPFRCNCGAENCAGVIQ